MSERFEGMDTAQADVAIVLADPGSGTPEQCLAMCETLLEQRETANDTPGQENITVDELINRMKAQAQHFSQKSQTRLVLANAARALVEMAIRLDAAERLIKEKGLDVPSIILLPGGQR